MEARLQGEDLEGLEEGLKEYALAAAQGVYAERLAKLKDEAAREQAQSKTAVLTKNIQARFNELQALIDRYLDDECFTTLHRGPRPETRGEERGGEGQGEATAGSRPTAPAAAGSTPPPAAAGPRARRRSTRG